MRNRWPALLLLGLAAPLLAAASPKLVPDVAPRSIEIRSGFTGAELLLFGAILYPKGVAPDEQVDIVVVVRGPPVALTVREKQKVAGIWINAANTDFRSVPSFYAVASTRPLRRVVDENTAAIWEFGLPNLWLSPIDVQDATKLKRFGEGLTDLYRRQGLYRQGEGSVEITDQVLYRARIAIPASAPVGRYTAETFLVRGGRVVAAATRDVVIGKSGFERFVATVATRYGLLYGLVAVAISLLLGWLAGVLFRRG